MKMWHWGLLAAATIGGYLLYKDKDKDKDEEGTLLGGGEVDIVEEEELPEEEEELPEEEEELPEEEEIDIIEEEVE